MPMIVYGDLVSGNCLKIKWVADRLGIEHVWRHVDVVRSETRTPEFLEINPAGQVPVVRFDDGRTLAQSNAIMLHLAEGSDLIPAAAFDRARMFEWLFWEQYSHEPYIAVARFQMAYLGRPREALEPRLFERGHAALKLMDAELSSRPFLVESGFSLADIALVAYTRVAHEGGFDLAAYPAVASWVGRVEAELGLNEGVTP